MKKLYNHPKIVILVIGIVTLLFAMQMPKIVIDNDVKIFLPKSHISRLNDDKASETFGSSDAILLAVKFNSENIFTAENIALIDKLTKKFESFTGVDEVKSLTNTDFIEGTAEGMEVEAIVNDLPQTKEDLDKIKHKLLSWKSMYAKSLYTDDFKSTTLLVQLEDGTTAMEQEEIFQEIRAEVNTYFNDKNMTFYLAGQPVLNTLMGESMQVDMKKLIPFVMLIVITSLFISFKTIGGVILPLLTVLISTIWSIGLMAGLGIPLTMVSTIIPVLLIAVGSAYGIHIISHYYDDVKSVGKKLTDEEHKEIVLHNVHKVGKAVFLAGLTTIAGFGSLATSKIIPIKNFGLFTALGVFGALVVAVTLIPSILLLKKPKVNIENHTEETLMTKLLMYLYHFFTRKKSSVILLTAIIMTFSIYGTSKVIIDSVLVEFFKQGTPVREADEYLNANFNGSNFINVVIDGKEKGDLTNPEILKAMDNMKEHFVSNHEYVGQVISFSDFIKRMNKVMNYPEETDLVLTEKAEAAQLDNGAISSDFNDSFDDSFSDNSFEEDSFEDIDNTESIPLDNQLKITKPIPSREKISEADLLNILNSALLNAKKVNLTAQELVTEMNRATNYQGEAYNEVPYDPAKYPAETREELKNLVSQYLLLYSGELDSFADDRLEPKSTRMLFQLKSASNIFIADLKDEISRYAEENFPKGYTVTVSGAGDMSLAVNNLIVSSQIISIITSLIIVFIIVAYSFKSVIAGIYGIIPLIISLFINFGLMGFAGIKLDIGTAMVASIAIGIGVDYTIHFLTTYHYERMITSDLEIVTKKTLNSSGKAIIFNAISVALGFAVLIFSNFNPIKNLGLLVCITMITSSMGSMILLPILLNLFKPKFVSTKGEISMKNMKLSKKIIMLGLGILLTIPSFAITGTEVSQLARDRDTGNTVMAAMQMKLISRDGKVESDRRLMTWGYKYDIEKDLSKVVMEFKAPASIAKTRFLQIENEIGKDDDKWIFLPALGRVRRISSSDKTSSFVGSDFTYGDMETREVSEDTHKLLKEEKYGKNDCYVVESVPVEKDDSQYSKRVTWVTKDSYVPVKAELYSKKTNEIQKRLTVQGELKKVQGIWSVFSTTMEDLETGHKTLLDVVQKDGKYLLRYNGKMNPKRFTQSFIKTGRAK